MSPIAAWTFLLIGYLLPITHIIFSSKGGTWTATKEAKCPIGSRFGWLIIVLFLGPIGWLMYMRKR